MILAFILLLFLQYSCGLLLVDKASRHVNKVLTVTNGAAWGYWHEAEFCPTGTFANGISFKIEGEQDSGDDTALTGIKLHCASIDHPGYGGDITSGVAPWGGWTAVYHCPKQDFMSQFLTSFEMQVEANQGDGDDTAVNYAKFKCRNFGGNSTENTIPTRGGGLWGHYGSWSESCPDFTAICGIQTRVEPSIGSGDDTALNDAKLFCCDE